MRAGRLKNLVSLQARTPAQLSTGQPVDNWIEIASPWANILNLNGKEFIAAGSETSEVTVSILMRYRSDITAGMRIVYKTNIYDIKAVLPDEADQRNLYLTCTTGASNG